MCSRKPSSSICCSICIRIYRQQPWKSWRTVRGLGSAWRALAREHRARPIGDRDRHGRLRVRGGARLRARARHSDPAAGAELRSGDHDALLRAPRARRLSRLSRGGGEAAPRRAHGAVRQRQSHRAAARRRGPSRAEARAAWGFPPSDGRVVLAFGGSQGARPLNDAIASMLEVGLPPGRANDLGNRAGKLRSICALRVASACACARISRRFRVHTRRRISPSRAPARSRWPSSARGEFRRCSCRCRQRRPTISGRMRVRSKLPARRSRSSSPSSPLPRSVAALGQLLGAPAKLAGNGRVRQIARGRPDAAERIASWILRVSQLKSVGA